MHGSVKLALSYAAVVVVAMLLVSSSIFDEKFKLFTVLPCCLLALRSFLLALPPPLFLLGVFVAMDPLHKFPVKYMYGLKGNDWEINKKNLFKVGQWKSFL